MNKHHPKTDPFVSVVIPCRNEEAHISACLESLLANDYPEALVEIIVADGISTDATRGMLADYSRRFPRVRMIDNPRAIVPSALNIGIRSAKGQVITIAGAHSIYPREYIRRCVRLLQESGAGNVGGRLVTLPNGDGPWAIPIARVTSHRFGVGNGAFRTSDRPGFVDTVTFGTYWKDIFDEIGYFDERLTRNQDNELNARLTAAGHKIVFDPTIRVEYKNQATLRGLMRQAFHTGAWNVYALRLQPHSFQTRRFIPAAFALYLTLLPLSSLLTSAWFFLPAVFPLAAYLVIDFGASFVGQYDWRVNTRTLTAFFAYHVSYGFGAWFGLLNLATGRWKNLLGKPLRS